MFRLAFVTIMVFLLYTCRTTNAIKDGLTAFELKRYAQAAGFFEKDYQRAKKDEERAYYAYMLGRCNEAVNDTELMLKWYRKSAELDPDIDALASYAYALKSAEQYEEAAKVFSLIVKNFGEDDEFSGQIEVCRQALKWKNQQSQSIVELSAVSFNTVYSEYAPYLIDEDQLLFSSDRRESEGGLSYPWTGADFSDLFVYNFNTQQTIPFFGPVNTEHNEGSAVMSADRKSLYFTRCIAITDDEIDDFCKIYLTEQIDGVWSEPKPLEFQKEGVNYMHPALFRSDSFLIFSSNDPKGFGGYDLYGAVRTPSGWETPFIFDQRINTPGNEVFPTTEHDTLYFSSDYIAGMGGLDIFKSYRQANGRWSKPLNLKPPINSGADDFAFLVIPNSASSNVLKSGYFSSGRASGNGADDIFAFGIKTNPDFELIEDKQKENTEYLYYLAVQIYAVIREDVSNPNSDIIGRNPVKSEQIVWIDQGDVQQIATDKQGRFIRQIVPGRRYTIRINDPGYYAKTEVFSTEDIKANPDEPIRTFNLRIDVEPIVRGTEFVLDDIYYDFDEAYIREDAKPTLNRLALLLKENPSLRIRLGAHTDCRGEEKYNKDLSAARAQAAVRYLIGQGIDPSRLQSKGYGKERPIEHCPCQDCTEEQHQKNRRTTFEIL